MVTERFLSYLWRSSIVKAQIRQGARTTAGIFKINQQILERIELPLLPLDEQRQAVAALDAVDALRDRRRRALQALPALAASAFRDMFGDPVGPKVSGRLVALSSIADIRTGPFGSLLHQDDYVHGGVPLVNPSHIVNGRIETSDTQSVRPEKARLLRPYQLEVDDIVMGRRGEMGRCAAVGPEHSGLLCGTGSLIVRPDTSRVRPGYLVHVLSHPDSKRYLERASLGTTMMNLNQKVVGGLSIILPTLEDQRRFEQTTAAVTVQEQRGRTHLAELDALFASVQDRAFRGELTLA